MTTPTRLTATQPSGLRSLLLTAAFASACSGDASPKSAPTPTAPNEGASSVAAASGSMSGPHYRMTFELGAVSNTSTLVKGGQR